MHSGLPGGVGQVCERPGRSIPGRAVQFGYVCLFAAAMPVGAAIACLYTAVEMRSDLVKLLHVCRRPTAERRLSIGAWRGVMQVRPPAPRHRLRQVALVRGHPRPPRGAHGLLRVL